MVGGDNMRTNMLTEVLVRFQPFYLKGNFVPD